MTGSVACLCSLLDADFTFLTLSALINLHNQKVLHDFRTTLVSLLLHSRSSPVYHLPTPADHFDDCSKSPRTTYLPLLASTFSTIYPKMSC